MSAAFVWKRRMNEWGGGGRRRGRVFWMYLLSYVQFFFSSVGCSFVAMFWMRKTFWREIYPLRNSHWRAGGLGSELACKFGALGRARTFARKRGRSGGSWKLGLQNYPETDEPHNIEVRIFYFDFVQLKSAGYSEMNSFIVWVINTNV